MLIKSKTQLKKDWELVAKSDNYMNAIAQGFSEEDKFEAIGKSQFESIGEYLYKNKVTLRDKKIIEIGCGAGRITKHIANIASSIYATDISMNMLRRFKERVGCIGNVTLLCTGDLSIFTDKSVDIVFSYLVFQHNPENIVEEFIKESVRVLKPGGYLIFQLTTAEKHQVVKSKSRATDMVRWTKEELTALANKYSDYKLINPVGSLLNIWQIKEVNN